MKNKKLITAVCTALITASVAYLGFSQKFSFSKERPENTMNQGSASSFYDFTLTALDGKEIKFEEFKGKKVLLVNVASKCGFTPQYKDLQKLHEMYGNKVTVLGFPANNFANQESGTNDEIASFCEKNYGVTFQMFEKISVKGKKQHPLYAWLSDKDKNGWNDKAPSWNFCKYLVDEDGSLVSFYGPRTKPMDEDILNKISE